MNWRVLLAVFWLLAAGYAPTLGEFNGQGVRLVLPALVLLLSFQLDGRRPERRRLWWALPLVAGTAVAILPLVPVRCPLVDDSLIRYWEALVLAWAVYAVWALRPEVLRLPWLGLGWLVLGYLVDGPVGQGLLVAGVLALPLRSDRLMLWGSLGLCMWIGYVGYEQFWSPDWFHVKPGIQPWTYGIWIAVAVAALGIMKRPGFLAFVVLAFALRALLLVGCQDPAIDLYDIQEQACHYVLAGQNPYAHQSYLSDTLMQRVHASIDTSDERFHTFVYPPGIVYCNLPGYALTGDVRYNYFWSDLALMALWLSMGGEPLLVGLYLFIPGFQLISGCGWTDPYVALWMSLLAWLFVRRHMAWFYACLGAALPLKHQALPLWPAALKTELPQQSRYYLYMAAGLLLPVLPFVIGNGAEFLREMTVTARMAGPLDSLCLRVYLVQSGLPWVTVGQITLVGVAAAGLGWLVQRRSLYGLVVGTTFSMLSLFFLGKWCYINYYWLVMSGLLLGMLLGMREESADSKGSSSRS